MKGRKPTPINLRLLHGNPSRRPLPKDEPKLKAKILAAPPGLPKETRRLWRRLARQLANARVSTELDSLALRALCESYSSWESACEVVRRTGMINAQKDANGRIVGIPYQNPYLSVANRAFDQFTKLLIEFGMTPSSRTRVSVAPYDRSSPEEANARDLFGF